MKSWSDFQIVYSSVTFTKIGSCSPRDLQNKAFRTTANLRNGMLIILGYSARGFNGRPNALSVKRLTGFISNQLNDQLVASAAAGGAAGDRKSSRFTLLVDLSSK